MHNAHDFPSRTASVSVTVEVPRGSFIKRDADGHIDLISPFPAPFNYGRIEGRTGGDGEPLDAVLLGHRQPRGSQHTVPVWGVVHFQDGGEQDHKWVCGPRAPNRRERWALRSFFASYALLKNARDLLQLRPPSSRFSGWHPTTPG